MAGFCCWPVVSEEEEKGEVVTPVAQNPDVGGSADVDPRIPNPDEADEPSVAAFFVIPSNGFGTLYFAANFANISDSRPIYFSSVLSTSPTFKGLCF